MPPGFDVTVYVVIVLPLLLVGGVNVTLALAPTSVAVPIVGAFGTAGVLKYGPVLTALVPAEFVAASVAEYTVLFGNNVAVNGDDDPVTVFTKVEPL
jgi:hypothetical protein